MRQLGTTTTARRRVLSGSGAAAALIAAIVVWSATAAGAADPGWSRAPASGIGGGTVHVASSAATLCQWVQPADPNAGPPTTGDAPAISTDPTTDPAAATPAGDTIYDGTEVRIRLSRDGVDTQLASLPVERGGAWSDTITLPATGQLVPGDYDLFAKCVIDRPELDGVRTYDFDPLTFVVVEAPPPTTTVTTPELIPPVTAVNPVEVQGTQLSRPATAAPAAASAPAAATLPNTGDGTLETALAGLGALLVGAGALWWGARHGRQHTSAELVD